MSVTAADMLPGNAGAFEKAAAIAITDVLPVPLRQIVDPAQTPDAFLPFLAAHESVDLWFEDWSEDRKRAMVAEAVSLAVRKGLRIGVVRFLSYVDATMLDVIAYPAKFIFGRARIGRTPIGHPAFLARYLIKVETRKAPNSFMLTRGVIGRHAMKTPDREKFRRVFASIRVAKAPETEVRVDLSHKRQITLADALSLDEGFVLGAYVNRTKL